MTLLFIPWDEFLQQIIAISFLPVLLLIAFIAIAKLAIEFEKSNRSGVDVDRIDQIIEDARRRAYRRGHEEP